MSAASTPNSSDFQPNTPEQTEEMQHFATDCNVYPPPPQLDDTQRRAIDLTVQGLDDSQIARILAINRSTLWRWKTHDRNYRIALADARKQAFAGASDRYQHLLLRATDVLGKFLEDPMDNNRFRAAHALLMMAGNFRPQSDDPSPQPESDFLEPLMEPKRG
jgi:DNA-binding CsgD family transcriptional regulator